MADPVVGGRPGGCPSGGSYTESSLRACPASRCPVALPEDTNLGERDLPKPGRSTRHNDLTCASSYYPLCCCRTRPMAAWLSLPRAAAKGMPGDHRRVGAGGGRVVRSHGGCPKWSGPPGPVDGCLCVIVPCLHGYHCVIAGWWRPRPSWWLRLPVQVGHAQAGSTALPNCSCLLALGPVHRRLWPGDGKGPGGAPLISTEVDEVTLGIGSCSR